MCTDDLRAISSSFSIEASKYNPLVNGAWKDTAQEGEVKADISSDCSVLFLCVFPERTPA